MNALAEKNEGTATWSPPLVCALAGDLLHGIAFDDVACSHETGVSWGPDQTSSAGEARLRQGFSCGKTLERADVRGRFAAREGDWGDLAHEGDGSAYLGISSMV